MLFMGILWVYTLQSDLCYVIYGGLMSIHIQNGVTGCCCWSVTSMTLISNFLPPVTSVFWTPVISLDLEGQIKIGYIIPGGHMSMYANNYISGNCIKVLTSITSIYSFWPLVTLNDLRGQNHIAYFTFGDHRSIHAKNHIAGFCV